jgi:hypothetical protein
MPASLPPPKGAPPPPLLLLLLLPAGVPLLFPAELPPPLPEFPEGGVAPLLLPDTTVVTPAPAPPEDAPPLLLAELPEVAPDGVGVPVQSLPGEPPAAHAMGRTHAMGRRQRAQPTKGIPERMGPPAAIVMPGAHASRRRGFFGFFQTPKESPRH